VVFRERANVAHSMNPIAPDLAGVKALVTGGGGFIGSALVRALLARGAKVRVLDNFATGNRANLLEVADEVEIVEGELRSYERVHAGMRGIELVFHQAALPSVPRSVQDPLTTSAVNVDGTLNVLLAARDEGVRRLIFASSSSVYGEEGELPRRESQRANPMSPYAVSKLAAERYCISFSRIYGLETISLRYFNVFGPRQDPHSQYAAVVPRFISAVAAGRPVLIYGDGDQVRDFTFVSNVVDANLAAAQAPDASGNVINVATGRRTTVNELADLIGEVLGRPVARNHESSRTGDVKASWADIAAGQELLGWEPSVDLREGLQLTAESMDVESVALS
jgi:nucleoside-diphosphate-sugar epimerase